MRRRASAAFLAGVLLVALATEAGAQVGRASETARELAQLMLDDVTRRRIDEQVGRGMMQSLGGTLEERLSRRLLDMEWRLLGGIVERFLRETLPPDRTAEIAAEIYMRHFDETELRDLLAFQRSPVGRKAMRVAPAIANDTLRAIDREIRTSRAGRDMIAELHRAFPILGASESP
jgi:hypothetical protein